MPAEAGGERQILDILTRGTYQVAGQFVYGSNYTFLVELELEDAVIEAVYKPIEGERPLWDFPRGSLAQRETAAYHVCRALGWPFVPATVFRQDGPAGPGSLQQYVELDPERHYFNMSAEEKQQLKPVAVFDALINNADRKGGHVLLGDNDQIWLIDHGLCFHQEHKLRTVIWDFAGQPIPPELLERLASLLPQLAEGELAQRLSTLISPAESGALSERCQRLLRQATFPSPGEERHYPWPLV
jgi:uncharacterized repeat protein (TIGR03843 family)